MARDRDLTWPAGLTDREVEVLRLMAQGHSYQEVARRLTITPKTAEHHIEHIYNKIGVSARASAALFAMEHDLILRRPSPRVPHVHQAHGGLSPYMRSFGESSMSYSW